MIGVEIDFVVKNSLEALSLYEKIYEIEVVERSNMPVGLNEVIFNLYNVRFHMLDENKEYGLEAPTEDKKSTVWFNVMVEDIKNTYNEAIVNGCTEIQGVTELKDYGVSNAIFIDPYGYMWMLHEIHQIISHEDRVKIWNEKNI